MCPPTRGSKTLLAIGTDSRLCSCGLMASNLLMNSANARSTPRLTTTLFRTGSTFDELIRLALLHRRSLCKRLEPCPRTHLTPTSVPQCLSDSTDKRAAFPLRDPQPAPRFSAPSDAATQPACLRACHEQARPPPSAHRQGA